MRCPSLILLLVACGGANAGVDGGGVEAAAWPRSGAETDTLPAPPGMRVLRAIVHAHSVYSHDACDNDPQPDGGVNAECLEDFRRGSCEANVDVIALTEHTHFLGDVDFEDAVALEAGDEPVYDDEGGALIGKRFVCDDGRRVLVVMGCESSHGLMPVGLRRHPDVPEGGSLVALYNETSVDAVARFRDVGALVFAAHTEQFEAATLRPLALDGLEIYNLHASVDFSIRRDYLGLDPTSYVGDVLEFMDAHSGLAPDLAFLAIFTEAAPDLLVWDTLLSEGQHLTGTVATDCHQNALPLEMPDGERGDSYRRMRRWFGNFLLVDESAVPDPVDVLEALSAGRSYAAFDAYGTPRGFDFHAETPGGERRDLGDTAPVGSTLTVTRPTLDLGGLETSLVAPIVTLRVLHAVDGGAVEVASGEGETLAFEAGEPGAYRAEVRIVPEHTRPFLGDLADALIQDVPWVYSNPIWIE